MLWLAAVCATLIGGPAAWAKTEAPRPAGMSNAPLRSVESCVGAGRIDFAADDQTALLDDADLKAVHAEMVRQYPMLAKDGFAATHIVLWQRPNNELVYVTLLSDPNLDAPPSDASDRTFCFTATFAAAKLAPTPLLRRKYFFPVDAPAGPAPAH
jgi:hypothetical protein